MRLSHRFRALHIPLPSVSLLLRLTLLSSSPYTAYHSFLSLWLSPLCLLAFRCTIVHDSAGRHGAGRLRSSGTSARTCCRRRSHPTALGATGDEGAAGARRERVLIGKLVDATIAVIVIHVPSFGSARAQVAIRGVGGVPRGHVLQQS